MILVMRKKRLSCAIVTFLIVLGLALPSVAEPHRAMILIKEPKDISTKVSNRNRWFAGISLYYLHFRIGATNLLGLVPLGKVNHDNKLLHQDTQYSDDALAKSSSATHILKHSYEMNKDGSSVHYYAEVCKPNGDVVGKPFEKNIILSDGNFSLDPVIKWIFDVLNLKLEAKIDRFYKMNVLPNDLKQIKIMGRIASRISLATNDDIKKAVKSMISISDQNALNLTANYMTIQFYEELKNYSHAIELIENLLIVLPNYSSLHVNVCRNYRHLNKFAAALSFASSAERKGVLNPDLLLEGALTLEAMGRYNQAKKAFTEIFKRDSLELNAVLFFARQANRANNPKKALIFIEKIIAQNSSSGDLLFEQGKTLLKMNRYDDATLVLRKSIKLLKNPTEAVSMLAETEFAKNNFSAAAELYENVADYNENNFDLFQSAAKCWEKAGIPQNVMRVLKKAESHFSDSIILQRQLGFNALSTFDTTATILHLENYLKKIDNDVAVLMTLGDIYTGKVNYEKAFYMYKYALGNGGDKTNIAFKLALLYKRKNDYRAAITQLQNVIKLNHEFPMAHFNLAEMWYQVKRLDDAQKEYKKARYFSPQNAHIQDRIAHIYLVNEEYNASLREYEKLSTLTPQDANPYFYLTISALYLNSQEKASRYFDRAMKLGTPDAKILYRLGKASMHVNNNDNAILYLQQSVTAEPNNADALQLLSKLLETKKQFAEAAAFCLSRFNLNNANYYMSLSKAAELHNKSGNTEQAFSLYKKFIVEGFWDNKSAINLARIEFLKQHYLEIIKLLEKIPQEILKKDGNIIKILAESYVSTGASKKSISLLTEWIKKHRDDKSGMLMLAIALEDNRHFDEALSLYDKILAISNENEIIDIKHMIGMSHIKNDAADLAISQFSENIKLFPNDLRSYARLIELFAQKDHWGAVRDLLEKCITLPNVKPYYQKKLAEVCLKQNDKANAVKNYKEYLKKNSDDDDAWYRLAILYFDRGVYTKALLNLEKAYALVPDNLKIIFKTAETNFNLKNYNKSIALFSNYLKLDNNNLDALNFIAQSFRVLNNQKKLAKVLKIINQLDPKNYNVKIELGYTLISTGQTDSASYYLEKACLLKPQKAEAHLLLARIYESHNNNNGRFSHLRKALADNKDNADVNAAIGRFYREVGQNKKALKHVQKAIEINPNHTEALFVYSKYLYDAGEISKALTPIKIAVANDKYNANMLVLYAQITHALGQKEKAIETIQNALFIDSNSIEVLKCAGHIFKETGTIDIAKGLLIKAISNSDQCHSCYEDLGDIYFSEMECSKAIGYYKNSLKITNFNEDVMMKLGRALLLSYKNEDAQNIFNEVFTKNTNNHEAYYRLTHMYIIKKEFSAIDKLVKKRNVDIKTLWDHLVIGELHEAHGRIEAARISYTVALRLKNDLPVAFAGLGRLNLNEKKYNEAIVNFSKALVEDAFNPYLLMNLGRAYEGIKQYSSALSIYIDIANKYPKIPTIYLLLAGIHTRNNEHAKATNIIKDGISKNPDSAILYTMLGKKYEVLKHYAESANAYENALKHNVTEKTEIFLMLANIFHNHLLDEKNTKKYLKKYLRNGGDKKMLSTYNLANIQL